MRGFWRWPEFYILLFLILIVIGAYLAFIGPLAPPPPTRPGPPYENYTQARNPCLTGPSPHVRAALSRRIR
jgi:hypothetical protein